MRTTIDLPEDLLRRVKAKAALKGMKMKDFIALLLEHGILGDQLEVATTQPATRTLPVMIPAIGRKIPALTNVNCGPSVSRGSQELL